MTADIRKKRHGRWARDLVPTAAAVLAGFVVLLIWLAGTPPPNSFEAFFLVPYRDPANKANSHQKLPFPLKREEMDDGINRHVAVLAGDAGSGIFNARTISLHMVTYGAHGEVVSAKILISDKSNGQVLARYEVPRETVIQDNKQLKFYRIINPELPFSATGEVGVKLEIVSRGSPNLALWSEYAPEAPVCKFLWAPMSLSQGEPGFASIYGWHERPTVGPPLSRATLLASTWGISGSRAIYFAVCIAMALGTIGTLILATCSKSFPFISGICLLYAGIALVYVIIIPPFQAPDEPDHFLTYAYAKTKSDPNYLSESGLALANIGHFERLKFRTEEKFVAGDVGHPLSGGWASHVLRNDINRSPIAKVIWSAIGELLERESATRALLVLRLGNVAFLSFCVAVSLGIVVWGGRSDALTVFLVAPLLLAPSLVFYSTVVSNYSFLIGGYVFQMIALGVMWSAGTSAVRLPRCDAAVGILIGFGLIIAIGSSDNGVLCIAFWGLLIPVYWFVRGRRALAYGAGMDRCKMFLVFLVATMVLGWITLWALTGSAHILPEFLTWHLNRVLNGSLLAGWDSQALVAAAFIIPLIVTSLGAFWAGFYLREFHCPNIIRTISGLLVIIVMVLIAFAPAFQIPEARDTEGVAYYVWRVVYSFMQGLGPRMADWLVVRSFWGEFGWLDSPLPDILVGTLRIMTGIGLLLLLLALLFNKEDRQDGLFYGVLGALLAFTAAIAISYFYVGFGVNGRYLIGLYLLTMTAAAEGYRRAAAKWLPGRIFQRRLEYPVFAVVALTFHSTAWLAVLNRYF